MIIYVFVEGVNLGLTSMLQVLRKMVNLILICQWKFPQSYLVTHTVQFNTDVIQILLYTMHVCKPHKILNHLQGLSRFCFQMQKNGIIHFFLITRRHRIQLGYMSLFPRLPQLNNVMAHKASISLNFPQVLNCSGIYNY